tara:strand:- start:298 stop:528 length:231 start_codon:yes stop_codon:yes gene_type:complete
LLPNFEKIEQLTGADINDAILPFMRHTEKGFNVAKEMMAAGIETEMTMPDQDGRQLNNSSRIITTIPQRVGGRKNT